MKFKELLKEVTDSELRLFENFIKENFPSGSTIRYDRTKKTKVYATWEKSILQEYLNIIA